MEELPACGGSHRRKVQYILVSVNCSYKVEISQLTSTVNQLNDFYMLGILTINGLIFCAHQNLNMQTFNCSTPQTLMQL